MRRHTKIGGAKKRQEESTRIRGRRWFTRGKRAITRSDRRRPAARRRFFGEQWRQRQRQLCSESGNAFFGFGRRPVSWGRLAKCTSPHAKEETDRERKKRICLSNSIPFHLRHFNKYKYNLNLRKVYNYCLDYKADMGRLYEHGNVELKSIYLHKSTRKTLFHFISRYNLKLQTI